MSPRSSPRDMESNEYRDSRIGSINKLTNSFDNLTLSLSDQSTTVSPLARQDNLTQYTPMISMFSKILNLKDPSVILECDKNSKLLKKIRDNSATPQELFSKVIIPWDLWLKNDLVIKDVKVKITMLSEINGMMETELQNLLSNTSFEEITLNYYSKLLIAYKFYDSPLKEKSNNNIKSIGNNMFMISSTLQENDEEDEEFNSVGKPMYRTISNKSNISNNSNNKNRRMSNGSSISKRRFSSFLGGNNNTGKQSHISSPEHNEMNKNSITPPQLSSSRFPSNQDNISPTSHHNEQLQSPRQESNNNNNHNYESSTSLSSSSTLNSILSKSKLYNRMKKNTNRESTSSVNSNLSNHSWGSNRSSISTTNTGTTSIGSRRRSMGLKNTGGANSQNNLNGAQFSLSNNSNSSGTNSSVSSFVSASTIIPTPIQTSNDEELQKLKDILKDKSDYYLQVSKLNNIILTISKYIYDGPANNNGKLFKFLEFIKKYLFKFIIIDLYTMITNYVEF
ncbi:uncharacterized protein KGF55_005001 [Candida pseudojiufengensis]|uniref:uncharacterized protein n=1 Tax=Candida pseudojiufengensis TaxID=497109 RepID=UPI002224FA31|nr:uncharacterized protein KGF55_005001 [Candida pseudojiufengensis]KAI5959769.1 hypothetical protein KGF55_005001 [Candida pseudojiufengensis]